MERFKEGIIHDHALSGARELTKYANYHTKHWEQQDSKVKLIFNEYNSPLKIQFARVSQTGREVTGSVDFELHELEEIKLYIERAIEKAKKVKIN
jgi:hypothetical protein